MTVASLAAAIVLAAASHHSGARAQKILHPHTAEEFLTLSAAELKLGELSAAEKTARDGMRKHPESQGFHLALADVLVARNKPADAFYELEWEVMRAGAASPSGKTAAEKMGDLLKNARGPGADEMRRVAEATIATSGDAEKGLSLIRAVYAERGDIFVLRLLVAEAESEAGHRAKAIPIFRALIKEDPRFVPGYVDLAKALRADGKPAEADALLAKAKKIDPDSWALAPEPTPPPSSEGGDAPAESPVQNTPAP